MAMMCLVLAGMQKSTCFMKGSMITNIFAKINCLCFCDIHRFWVMTLTRRACQPRAQARPRWWDRSREQTECRPSWLPPAVRASSSSDGQSRPSPPDHRSQPCCPTEKDTRSNHQSTCSWSTQQGGGQYVTFVPPAPFRSLQSEVVLIEVPSQSLHFETSILCPSCQIFCKQIDL